MPLYSSQQITSDQIGVAQVLSRHLSNGSVTNKHLSRGSVNGNAILSGAVSADHISSDVENRLLPPPFGVEDRIANWRAALESTPNIPNANNPFITLADLRARANYWLSPIEKTASLREDPVGSVRLNIIDKTLYVVGKPPKGQRPKYEALNISHQYATDLESLSGHRHVTAEQRLLLERWTQAKLTDAIRESSIVRRFGWRSVAEALRFEGRTNEREPEIKTSYTLNDGFKVSGKFVDDNYATIQNIDGWRTLTSAEKADPWYAYGSGNLFAGVFSFQIEPLRAPYQEGQAQGTFDTGDFVQAQPEDKLFDNESISLDHGVVTVNSLKRQASNTSDSALGNTVYKPGNVAVKGMQVHYVRNDRSARLDHISFSDKSNEILWNFTIAATNIPQEEAEQEAAEAVLCSAGVTETGAVLQNGSRWQFSGDLYVSNPPTKTWVFDDGCRQIWLFALIKETLHIWNKHRDASEFVRYNTNSAPSGDVFANLSWKQLDIALVGHGTNSQLKYHLAFFGEDGGGLPRMYVSEGITPGYMTTSTGIINVAEATSELRSRFYTVATRELEDIESPMLVRSSRQRFNGAQQTGFVFKQRNELFVGVIDWSDITMSQGVVDPEIAVRRIQGPARACGRFAVEGLDDNGFAIAVETLPQRSVAVGCVRFGEPASVADFWYTGGVFPFASHNLRNLSVICDQPHRKTNDLGPQIGTAYNRFVHVAGLQHNGIMRIVTLRLSGTTSETSDPGDVPNTFTLVDTADIVHGVMSIDCVAGGCQSRIVFTDFGGVQRIISTSRLTRQASDPAATVVEHDLWDEPVAFDCEGHVVSICSIPYFSDTGYAYPLGVASPDLTIALQAQTSVEESTLLSVRWENGSGDLEPGVKIGNLLYADTLPNWLGASMELLSEQTAAAQHVLIMGGTLPNMDTLNATASLQQFKINDNSELENAISDYAVTPVYDQAGAEGQMAISCSHTSTCSLADPYDNFFVFVFGGLAQGRPYVKATPSGWINKLFLSKLVSDPSGALKLIGAGAELVNSKVQGGYGTVSFLHNVNGVWCLYVVDPSGAVYYCTPDVATTANGVAESLAAPTADDFIQIGSVEITTKGNIVTNMLAAANKVQWAGTTLVRQPANAPGCTPDQTWIVYVECASDFASTSVKVLNLNTSSMSSANVPLPDQLQWYDSEQHESSSMPSSRVESQMACIGTISSVNVAQLDTDCTSDAAVFLMTGGRSATNDEVLDDQWMLEIWKVRASSGTAISFKHRWTRLNDGIGLGSHGPLCSAAVGSLPARLDRGGNPNLSVGRVVIAGGSGSMSNTNAKPSFATIFEWPEAWNKTDLRLRSQLQLGQGAFCPHIGSSLVFGPVDVTNWRKMRFALDVNVPRDTSIYWMITTNPINDAWIRWSIVWSPSVPTGAWSDSFYGQTVTSKMLYAAGAWVYWNTTPPLGDVDMSSTSWLDRGTYSWGENENQLWLMAGFKSSVATLTPCLRGVSIEYMTSLDDVIVRKTIDAAHFMPKSQNGAIVYMNIGTTSEPSETYDAQRILSNHLRGRSRP